MKEGFTLELFYKVKNLCKEYNISIFELESHIGISRGVLYTWKKSAPSIEKVHRVAEYFDISIDYLMDHRIQGDNILHVTNGYDKTLVKKYLGLSNPESKKSIEQLIDSYRAEEIEHLTYENRLLEFISSSDSIKEDIRKGEIKLPPELLSKLHEYNSASVELKDA